MTIRFKPASDLLARAENAALSLEDRLDSWYRTVGREVVDDVPRPHQIAAVDVARRQRVQAVLARELARRGPAASRGGTTYAATPDGRIRVAIAWGIDAAVAQIDAEVS